MLVRKIYYVLATLKEQARYFSDKCLIAKNFYIFPRIPYRQTSNKNIPSNFLKRNRNMIFFSGLIVVKNMEILEIQNSRRG
jgi:hypothetical protein